MNFNFRIMYKKHIIDCLQTDWLNRGMEDSGEGTNYKMCIYHESSCLSTKTIDVV